MEQTKKFQNDFILSIEQKKILQGADRKDRPGLTKILLTSMSQQKNKNIRDSRDGLSFFAQERDVIVGSSWLKKKPYKKEILLCLQFNQLGLP